VINWVCDQLVVLLRINWWVGRDNWWGQTGVLKGAQGCSRVLNWWCSYVSTGELGRDNWWNCVCSSVINWVVLLRITWWVGEGQLVKLCVPKCDQLGVWSTGCVINWVCDQLGVWSTGCVINWVCDQLGVWSTGVRLGEINSHLITICTKL
jgi:hypothetical protein